MIVKSITYLLQKNSENTGSTRKKKLTCNAILFPVLLPGKSHGQRSLVGCSPWGLEDSDMTERLHFHFSLACIGEGNGNPLQCSCLENPRDGGAWWAAVSGVAQSRTRLKRLSSSSSSPFYYFHWFKKINSSLISITEKDQVNTERYIGRSKTMPVANGNYTFD